MKTEKMIKCEIIYDMGDGTYRHADYFIKKESNLATFKDEYDYNPFVTEDYLLEYDGFINGGYCTFPEGEETDIVITKTEFVDRVSEEDGLQMRTGVVKMIRKPLKEMAKILEVRTKELNTKESA